MLFIKKGETMNPYQVSFLDKCSRAGEKVITEKKRIVADFFDKPPEDWSENSLPFLSGLCFRGATKATKELIEIGKNLFFLGRAGAGVDNIDIEAATKKGLVVFNTPGANANAVKELVIAFTICAARNLPFAFSSIKQGKWEKKQLARSGSEISGKVLGVIGAGNIGKLVARDLHALGMEIIYYDPHEFIDGTFAHKVKNVSDVLARADFITLHVPGGKETEKLINKETLAKMKNSAVLINAARGAIVDLDAVHQALIGGKIKYYITDVFANEPPDFEHPIFLCENFAAIPHLGASTQEAEDMCSTMLCRQIRKFLLFGDVENSVNAPNVTLEFERNGKKIYRLNAFHLDVPHVLDNISDIRREADINVANQITKRKKSRGTAYTIIDFDDPVPTKIIKKISGLENIMKVRYLII
jgi:D-3-phosphoglycerate dehydrogenase / 2-oxoglutarate reductase